MEKINQLERPIRPETIRSLEGMTKFDISSKIAILAVILDIKPASLIQTDPILPAQIMEVEARMKKLFTEFGIVYKQDGIDEQNEPFVQLHYSVAKNPESLDRVRSAQSNIGNINEYHETLGRALGIPNSAINGFITGERLSQEEIEAKLSKEERAFMFFSPSQKGWESEAEMLRNLAAKVRQISPVLYAKALDQIKNRR